jgi:PST family polysaccharide transporter
VPREGEPQAVSDETVRDHELSAGEVRARAIEGVALIGFRGMVIRLIGFAGNIALARLLVPEEFGILALGTTVLIFAGFMVDAGVGAALLRRSGPLDEADLAAVLGFQLALTTGLAVIVAAVAAPTGEVGQVAAIMVAALPLGTLRTPTTLVLERSLRYGPMAFAEVVEVLVFVGWSVAAVALGAGVWGVATAVIARGATGTALLLRRSPVKHLRPTLDWSRVRGLLAFGLQSQTVQLVNIIRSQGMNVATALIAGLPVLGLWGLVERIMLLPLTLFEGLWRVSFPAIVRLAESGMHPARDMARALSVGTIAAGALLVGLAASAPASIPVVFGSQWSAAADAVPPACLALVINGPIVAAGVGYLYAQGDAGRVLLSSVLDSLAFAAVALALLPELGAEAMGWGWLAASIVDVLILGTALRHAGVGVIRSTAVPIAVATGAGLLGLLFARSAPPTVGTAILTGAGAPAVYLAVLLVCHRRPLQQAARTVRRAAGGMVARD